MKNTFKKLTELCSQLQADCKLQPPASPGLIRDATSEICPQVSRQVEQLWSICNGGDIAGMMILGTEEAYTYGADMFAFQNWGNGDFDCLQLYGNNAGRVYFVNHQSNVKSELALSLDGWFDKIYEELRDHGEVFHPKDYVINAAPDRSGAYAHVIDDLADVNCEITRWIKLHRI